MDTCNCLHFFLFVIANLEIIAFKIIFQNWRYFKYAIKGGLNDMKAKIHPDYFQTTIKCACGNVLETGSTKKDIRVEICSKCHPFFTGKQKLVDTAGRIERFRRKYAKYQNQTKQSA